MIALGHRPPTLAEEPGPRVRVRLAGGEPVVPVMNLIARIEPAVRRRDVRVALIVHTLLHDPFLMPERLAGILQRTAQEAEEALDAAAECRIRGLPLLSRCKDVWVLSRAALSAIEWGPATRRARLRSRGLLLYRRPDSAASIPIARHWLAAHERLTSGDYAALGGLTQTGALRQLERLEAEGVLIRGAEMGRNAHFLAGPALLARRPPEATGSEKQP